MATENKTLATFRIEEGTWTAFKEKARKSGSTASEMLIGFVEAYLAGTLELPGKAEASNPAPDISNRIDDIERRLALLESIQTGELVA